LHRLCALLSAGRRLGLIVILVMAHGTATFAGTLEVVRPLAEAPGDIRYDHYWQLLMQTLAIDFGPFVLRAAGLPMTELRSMQELESGRGTITVLMHGNVADYERRLMPIRFPLDKSLLGYRVFLISGEMQSNLNLVGGLDDLRRYRIGQGREWGDVTILRQAGLTVVEGASYEGLSPL
jgi:hypothetical protein